MSNSNDGEKVYECQTCRKTFSRHTYLQLHEKIHGEKRHKCNLCNKAFSQPAGLWIHKKRQSCMKPKTAGNTASSYELIHDSRDDGARRHKCDVCNKGFSQKHLLNYHKRVHSGENPYSCTVCNKMFRGATTLKYHERTHTGQKPHKCIFCVKAFSQLGPLKKHCRNEHQTENIYECEVCKEKFEKFRELSAHKKIHFEVSNQDMSPCKTVTCTKTVKSETASTNVTRAGCQCLDESMEGAIETCSEPSDKESSGSTHGKEDKYHISAKEEHSTPASLICTLKDECNGALDRTRKDCFPNSDESMKVTNEAHVKISVIDSFVCMSGNEEHSPSTTDKKLKHSIPLSVKDKALEKTAKQEQNTSLGGKTYQCSVCNQEFSHARVLKYHQRTHSGENPHPCRICDKTFRTPGALTVHERTHNGQKPYKCIFCSKGFTQRGTLQQHCRRIHDSDQIYECDVCKERFEKSRDLKSHKHIHSDVPCTMVRPTSNVNLAVKYEDDVQASQDFQASQEFESTVCEVLVDSPIRSLDFNLTDFDEEDKCRVLSDPSCQVVHKTSTTKPYSSYQEARNMAITFSDEFSSTVSCIKQEKKEDCECSTDSGIFADTSPYTINFESDKQESDILYEVTTQPIKMEYEKNEHHLSILTEDRLRATSNMEFPQHNPQTFSHRIDVEGYSKTDFNNMSPNADTDHVFSGFHGDIPQNSSFDEESQVRSSCRFSFGNHSTYFAEPPGTKRQKVGENETVKTSKVAENDNLFSGACYSNGDFLSKSANADNSSSIRAYSDVFYYNGEEVSSRMDSTCNFRGKCGNQKQFAKIKSLAGLENSITSSSLLDKMFPVVNESPPKCVCARQKTSVQLNGPQQHPTYDIAASGTQHICLKCDVLPSSSHFVV